jgi:hypothetical protein
MVLATPTATRLVNLKADELGHGEMMLTVRVSRWIMLTAIQLPDKASWNPRGWIVESH